jgi:8-oxo-dGTP pyrophosphatase MutT (NUDIX family)
LNNGNIEIGPPRCRGLVFDGDALLMVRFNPPDEGDHWQIPGGGSEPGESLGDCLIREIKEETGLIVKPGRFCYLAHVVVGNRVNPHMYFEAEPVGGALDDLSGMTSEESEWFVERRFVKRHEPLEIPAFPQHGVWDRVWDDRELGFPEPVYLGAFTWKGSRFV